jgi:hypothetical protein
MLATDSSTGIAGAVIFIYAKEVHQFINTALGGAKVAGTLDLVVA